MRHKRHICSVFRRPAPSQHRNHPAKSSFQIPEHGLKGLDNLAAWLVNGKPVRVEYPQMTGRFSQGNITTSVGSVGHVAFCPRPAFHYPKHDTILRKLYPHHPSPPPPVSNRLRSKYDAAVKLNKRSDASVPSRTFFP